MRARWLVSIATCVLALGCGGSDDGGGSGGGGNSGGSSSGGGGSGAGGGSGGTSNSAALDAACYAMCDQQETGDNCLPEYTKTCKDGCDVVTPGLNDKCPDVAKAYYDCNAGIAYACFLGLPSAKDPNACKAEDDAMSACTK